MWGVQQNILQQFPNAWYSEMLYTQSIPSGPGLVAFTNYGEFGAKYILITALIFSWSAADAAAQISFTDQTGRVLFAMNASRAANGGIPLVQLIRGDVLFVAADTVDNLLFSVQHQYLREVDLQTTKHW